MTKENYTFIHAADLHIDSPLRGLAQYEEAPVEDIRGATRRAFENLVQYAIKVQVEFVILAGDVFDGDWKDFNTGLWFTARLRDLTSKGIRVYILAGNHDAEGKMTAKLQYPDGVRTFGTPEPETFVDEVTGAVLHGQGFAKPNTTEDLASGYPAATPGALNIGVLHTALSGRDGHDPYAPCSLDTLRGKEYDYWALGHVHQREVLSEDPWIVFPGNLQARHIRETGSKGATRVTVEDGRIETVEGIVCDCVRYAPVTVDVSGCSRRTECEDAVEDALAEARNDADGRLLAVRIEVTGRSPANTTLRREESAFVAGCHDRANALGDLWVERVRINTRSVATTSGHDIIQALELDADDLRTAALEKARGDIDDVLGKLPAAIMRGGDIIDLRDKATLDALVDEARDEVARRLVDMDAVVQEEGEA
jgi:DNA repair exonuclease SbcCD nuclease subunit